MKKLLTGFLLLISSTLIFAAVRPSLDGRAIVADEGILPDGLYAKTVGYLPGDSVCVTNPNTGVVAEVFVLGSIDPSEGVAILLSPKAANQLGIEKNSNIQVKITKRGSNSGAFAGQAILASSDGSFSEIASENFDGSASVNADTSSSNLSTGNTAGYYDASTDYVYEDNYDTGTTFEEDLELVYKASPADENDSSLAQTEKDFGSRNFLVQDDSTSESQPSLAESQTPSSSSQTVEEPAEQVAQAPETTEEQTAPESVEQSSEQVAQATETTEEQTAPESVEQPAEQVAQATETAEEQTAPELVEQPAEQVAQATETAEEQTAPETVEQPSEQVAQATETTEEQTAPETVEQPAEQVAQTTETVPVEAESVPEEQLTDTQNVEQVVQNTSDQVESSPVDEAIESDAGQQIAETQPVEQDNLSDAQTPVKEELVTDDLAASGAEPVETLVTDEIPDVADNHTETPQLENEPEVKAVEQIAEETPETNAVENQVAQTDNADEPEADLTMPEVQVEDNVAANTVGQNVSEENNEEEAAAVEEQTAVEENKEEQLASAEQTVEPEVQLLSQNTTSSENAPIVLNPSPVDTVVKSEVTQTSSGVVKSVSEIDSSKYYIQIATISDENLMMAKINQYNKYPLFALKRADNSGYNLLVGPVTEDEYGMILTKFRSFGFKDAFVKKIDASASTVYQNVSSQSARTAVPEK